MTSLTSPTSQLQSLLPLINLIPEGYFAVQLNGDAPLHFLRLFRPKSRANPKKNFTKIQTVSGHNLHTVCIIYPDSRISIYSHSVVDDILLILVDYRGAALRYAQEVGRCARCNFRLTDSRSRHYGIGPECEKHWPWMISQVDSQSQQKDQS